MVQKLKLEVHGHLVTQGKVLLPLWASVSSSKKGEKDGAALWGTCKELTWVQSRQCRHMMEPCRPSPETMTPQPHLKGV